MSNKPTIALIDGGAAYHTDSYEREPLKDWFDRVIYLRDLPRSDLSDVDVLIVPCRTSPYQLSMLSEQLQAFMRAGGTLAVMGETRPDLWLPHVSFEAQETNFWWWLEEGADLGVTMCAPGHKVNDYITKEDATYHIHGVLKPLAEGQVSLINDVEGECLMFEDTTSYAPGRLVVTTLDPFFHHGMFFMPATTRFLLGLLPWLADSHAAQKAGQAQA